MSNIQNAQIAGNLLGLLRRSVQQATIVLARRCAKGTKLDADLLDAQQVPSFEIAWASAELLCAEHALAALGHEPNELDRRLIVVFATEAITLVRDRLERLAAELDLADASIVAITADPAFRQLQREVLSSSALHATATLFEADPDALGRMPVSAELQMIRDQFVRFAAETVSPLADSIHRQDLTVPERYCDRCARWGFSASRFRNGTVEVQRMTSRTT